MNVFQLAADILLDMSLIDPREVEFLTHVNMQKLSNVRPFSASLVPDLLRRILPSDCFSSLPVIITSLLGHTEVISFLKEFWAFVKLHPDVLMATVEGAALLPTTCGLLLPVSRMSHCIALQRAEAKLSDEMISILQTLGARVVDETVVGSLVSSMSQVFWDYVHSPVRQGVLTLLDLLLRSSKQKQERGGEQKSGGRNDSDVFESLSVEQRDQLLSYIAESEQISTLTGK
jgi:hypothetical protein